MEAKAQAAGTSACAASTPADKGIHQNQRLLKVKQKQECSWLEPAKGWDEKCLHTLSEIYNEMYRIRSAFIQSPSIFYFPDPVASVDVTPA